MPKRSKASRRPISPKNSLLIALQSGKNITGLKGYVPIDGGGCGCNYRGEERAIYALVKITGIAPNEDRRDCNSVTILGELADGIGQLTIDPLRFFDDLADVKTEEDMKSRLDQAREDHSTIGAVHYSHQIRRNLEEYTKTKFTADQLLNYWRAVHEAGFMKPSDTKKEFVEKMPLCELKKWSAIACLEANGLPAVDENKITNHSW